MAPHEKRIRSIEKKCIRDMVEEIRDEYLPQNINGGSVWIVKQETINIGLIEFPSRGIAYCINPEGIVSEEIDIHIEIMAECTEYKSSMEYIRKNNTFIIQQ